MCLCATLLYPVELQGSVSESRVKVEKYPPVEQLATFVGVESLVFGKAIIVMTSSKGVCSLQVLLG